MKRFTLVFDAIYTPIDTKLLVDAKDSGCIAVSGVEMFLRQAKGQYELYTDGAPGNSTDVLFFVQFHCSALRAL